MILSTIKSLWCHLLIQEKTRHLPALAQYRKHQASSRATELALFGHDSFYSSISLWNTSIADVGGDPATSLHSTGALSITFGSGHHFTRRKLPAPSTTALTLGHIHYKEVSLEKPPAALSDFLSGFRGCMGTDPAQQAVCVLMST